MTYLFLLSIAPVQSFISQARKAHDLFAGSRLLSELCRAGILEAKKHWGKDCIVMPNPASASIPNRFLAKLESNLNPAGLQEQGEKVEKAITRLFETQAGQARMKLPDNPAGFDVQISQHLDIQWLFVPENGDYQKAFGKINEGLAAIKNVRQFSQMD